MKYLVIGSGSIGQRHFSNLVSLGADAELLSWRDHGRDGIANKIILLKGNVAVVICTATSIRREIIEVCVENCAPMYVEKPLGYRKSDLDYIYARVDPALQKQSFVGFMMRYHPINRYVSSLGLENIVRVTLQVGHDVTKWRSDWDFATSYAADPEGGGVLLDLCHEVDIASNYLQKPKVISATCLSHSVLKEVDVASSLQVSDMHGCLANIQMDYLAPSLVRNGTLVSTNMVVEYDFVKGTVKTYEGDVANTMKFEVQRNEMFLDIMSDFMKVVNNDAPESEVMPRMDLVKDTSYLIADAWERRQFIGSVWRSKP